MSKSSALSQASSKQMWLTLISWAKVLKQCGTKCPRRSEMTMELNIYKRVSLDHPFFFCFLCLFGVDASIYLFLSIFPPSVGDYIRQSCQDQWWRSDEGGQLHGARCVRSPAPHPLLPGLGRQVFLAATVVHANLCLWLHHDKTKHSYCQERAINCTCFCTHMCTFYAYQRT